MIPWDMTIKLIRSKAFISNHQALFLRANSMTFQALAMPLVWFARHQENAQGAQRAWNLTAWVYPPVSHDIGSF